MSNIPPEPPDSKLPRPEKGAAKGDIDDLEGLLRKLPPDDPQRKLLSDFQSLMAEAFAKFQADQVDRSLTGVPPDPKRALDFALFQFSNWAIAELRIVKDVESALQAELDSDLLTIGIMDWFVQWLRTSCPHDEETAKALCTQLNLKLLKMSNEAAAEMWRSVREQETPVDAPPPAAPASPDVSPTPTKSAASDRAPRKPGRPEANTTKRVKEEWPALKAKLGRKPKPHEVAQIVFPEFESTVGKKRADMRNVCRQAIKRARLN
jgi:hypothetical protein